MTEAEIHIFHTSLARCIVDPRFFDKFYERFLRSSPEVAEKFQNTNFHHQKNALKLSFYAIQSAAVRRTPDFSELAQTARRHGRTEADIAPRLYDLWLETLIGTAAEIDALFTEDVANVWRTAFRPAIEYMIAHY